MTFSHEDIVAISQRFGSYHRVHRGTRPSVQIREQAAQEINAWFAKIPVRVEWHKGDEPYNAVEELRRDILCRGVMKMRDYMGNGYKSPFFGDVYNRMRAVHDFFGHFGANAPFTVVGELAAYGVHVGMFSPRVMPLIFNEIVLSNAVREAYGEPAEDKFVRFVA